VPTTTAPVGYATGSIAPAVGEAREGSVDRRPRARKPRGPAGSRCTHTAPMQRRHASTAVTGFPRKFNRRKTSRWFPTRSLMRRCFIPGVNTYNCWAYNSTHTNPHYPTLTHERGPRCLLRIICIFLYIYIYI